jgi:hypothetical protein
MRESYSHEFFQSRRTQYGCSRVGACSLYGGLCAHRHDPRQCAGFDERVCGCANLVDIHTGQAPGTAPAIATVPVSEINTLADILSSCVNSGGRTSSTAGCGRLFTAATPAGGIAPGDTAAAALNIARNTASLFSCLPSSGAYQPTLVSAPADWTIAINYVSPVFNVPADLSIDSLGNAWVLSGSSNSSNLSILNTNGITATFRSLE